MKGDNRMRKIMKLIAFLGLAFFVMACSDDDSPVTPQVVKVTGVTLNVKEVSLMVGAKETLKVVVAPENATNKRVTWSSNKTDVASVDGQGVVTAHKAGEALVTVKSEDGGKTATCKVTVKAEKVAVTGVKLDKTEHTLAVGGTVTLVATVTPEGATNKKVAWKSDKTDIATVDENGKVTALKAGVAKITVTTEDGKKTATCTITVKEDKVAVTGVTLNKTELSMTVGGSFQLVATISPKDATNQKVTWKSSDSDVADVDQEGLVAAVKAGKATITATTEDGKKTATCAITVKEDKVAVIGVKLNSTSLSLTEGDSYQLKATVSPINATNQNVTWKSSNSNVADVDQEGLVVAVKAGTATITVTTEDGNKTATCTVTVKADKVAVAGVTLNMTSLSMKVNETYQLKATISPADATNQNVKWESSDSSVADVDQSGLVGALKEGTATITVTTEDGNKTAICTVTVKSGEISVTSVKLNKNTLSLVVSKNETLIATITPANATNKAVVWSSSDPSVAEVYNSGLVIACSEGTAIITVTTVDGNKKDSCKVTVEKVENNINAKGYKDKGTW